MDGRTAQNLILVITATVMVMVLAYLLRRLSRKSLRLPPGPPGWPVLGNLLHIGKTPYQSLSALSKQYGPLMFLWMGSYPLVIVSSPDMAREFLKTQGEVFASRPYSLTAEILSYNQQSVGSAPYGRGFHLLRRICMELLLPKRILQFQDARREEIVGTVLNILGEAKDGKPVIIREKLFELSNNIITRMLFKKSFYSLAAGTDAIKDTSVDEFGVLVKLTIELAMATFIGNYVPYLRWLDLGGVRAKMWSCRARWDKFLDEVIDQHRVPKRSQDKALVEDFVDTLLSIQKGYAGKDLSDERVKAILRDLIVAGNDTSAATVSWSLMELMRNREVCTKLRKELDTVVGTNRLVTEADLPNMPYLHAVVKETMRLHPVIPLMLPHESTNLRPIKVAGYDIPATTRLLVNVYAIQRDPSLWENPLKFNPERFINSSVDVKGHHFELLPFGSGRRSCPGMNVALLMMQLTLAQLLHTCDWSLPKGMKPEDLEDIEEFRGFLRPKPIPLHIFPRLPLSVYRSPAT